MRDTLQFKGLVVTDALEMGGITNRFWGGLAAVRAIQAGADVLILPQNVTVAINEVERAVRRGDISESRINESAGKLLRAKSRLGLHRLRTVSIKRIGEIIASPENTKLAQDIADQSVTVLKDDQQLLPIDPTRYARVFSLVLTPDLESAPGAVFQTEMRQRFPLTRTIWANARVSDELLASIDKAASETDLIVCSTFIRLVSGQAAAAVSGCPAQYPSKAAGHQQAFDLGRFWKSLHPPACASNRHIPVHFQLFRCFASGRGKSSRR